MLSVRTPLEGHWSFLVLELGHALLFLALIREALRERRAGGGGLLGILVTAGVYGSLLDLAALMGVGGFEHGRFTVMIAERLPLYVALMYVNHLGLSWLLVARSPGPWWSRVAAAGVLGMLLDASLQVPALRWGWWVWKDDLPLFAARVVAIPVTNLLWMALSTAAFVGLALAWRTRRQASLAGGLGVVIGTPLLGALLFLPYHGLVALGVGERLVTLMALSLLVALGLPALRGGGLQGGPRSASLAFVALLLVIGLVTALEAGSSLTAGERVAGLLLPLSLGLVLYGPRHLGRSVRAG